MDPGLHNSDEHQIIILPSGSMGINVDINKGLMERRQSPDDDSSADSC